MIKLVRLPVLRLLLLKREIYERLKVRKIQSICMAGWQALPPSHTNTLEFSNF